MSTRVCIAASTLYYLHGGGHMWVYLNWALGFQSIGCRVIWLESVEPNTPAQEVNELVDALKARLALYHLAGDLALYQSDGMPLPFDKQCGCLDIGTAADIADLLLSQKYNMSTATVKKFRRTALLDIDPGLLQVWLSQNFIKAASYDYYFTIGETVGTKEALFSDCGIKWEYIPPCVYLDEWNYQPFIKSRNFTTVTHWANSFWEVLNGETYPNDKKTGFLPFIDLPRHTSARLELAILLGEDEEKDRNLLISNGWHLQDSHAVTSTPQDYRHYIQNSYGEFSCAKPSYVRLQSAWISDRTLCYLASGKPVVVQNTGRSRFLPDDAGMFRFHDLKGAVHCLSQVLLDYDKHRAFARALAEEFFDAQKVTSRLLEKTI